MEFESHLSERHGEFWYRDEIEFLQLLLAQPVKYGKDLGDAFKRSFNAIRSRIKGSRLKYYTGSVPFEKNCQFHFEDGGVQ